MREDQFDADYFGGLDAFFGVQGWARLPRLGASSRASGSDLEGVQLVCTLLLLVFA